jgi:undecaprenyl-diphosphatase
MIAQRVGEWLRRRLTIAQYLSLHLLVGLALSVACLLIFAELVEEVIDEREFTRVDQIVAEELYAAATPASTTFFLVITEFGFPVLWALALGVGLYFLWKRQRFRLAIWLVALAGGQVLNFLLKGLFARPRPSFSDPLATALYYSFPSGHAMMSLIVYGLIAYFIYSGLPQRWQRVLITSALLVLVFLIGLSRLYLGVHYLSDVLAGFAAGLLWLSFCITAANFLHEWRARRTP